MANNLQFPTGIGTNVGKYSQPYMLLTSYESKNAIESTGQSGFSNNLTNPDYNPGITKSSIAFISPSNLTFRY